MRNDAKIHDIVGKVQAADNDGTEPGNLIRYSLGNVFFFDDATLPLVTRGLPLALRGIFLEINRQN